MMITKLVSLNSLDLLKTLKKAGEIRDHKGILSVQVADDQILNGVFYHRKCQSTFTHKHDLDQIKKRKNNEKEKEMEVGWKTFVDADMYVLCGDPWMIVVAVYIL